MLIIEHRVNSLDHLRRVPAELGLEIDIRDYDGALRLVHDPLLSGELLEDLLQNYRHELLVFNTKCDGLTSQILAMAARHGISNFFFLDLAQPTLVQLARAGERRIAVRFSEFEPLESALAFAGQVDWVWVDCFTDLPLNADNHRALKQHFRICLVSPELQGHPVEAISAYRKRLRDMPIDAVCTDVPELWYP